MDRTMLASMREVEDTHWWYTGRRRILLVVLSRWMPEGASRLLDIGSGTGANLAAITRRFPHLEAVGIDAELFCREACAERGLDVRSASADSLPIGDGTQDIVTAFDVLEHLDADGAAAEEIARVLVAGGIAVVTVPAYQWLWGPHDALNDHRRRYTRPQVVRLLEAAGLEVRFASYINTALFPLAVLSRVVERFTKSVDAEQRVPPGAINAAFRAVFASERFAIARSVRLPWGLSVLAVARKR